MEVKPRGQDWSVRSFEYDKLGRLQTGWLPYAANSFVYASPPGSQIADRYVYGHDLLDRPTSSTHWPAGSNKAGDTITLTYRGAETEVKDELANVTKYTHNAFGEVIGISKQAAGQILQSSFDYDPMGRVVRAQDEDGNDYLYTFYRDGHLKLATLPTGKNQIYLRKPSGRVSSITAPNGDIVSFDYDVLGRTRTRMIQALGGCAAEDAKRVDTFNYDEQLWNIGRLTSVDSNHYVKKLDYDGIGNVTYQQFQVKGPGKPPPVVSIGTTFG